MAEPTYETYRKIANDLTVKPNSQGKKRLKEWHFDDNNRLFALFFEYILQAMMSAGGVITAGTVTRDTDEVRVQGRMGITRDAKLPLFVEDETYDFAGMDDGYYLLIMTPLVQTQSRTFADPETTETVEHLMVSGVGGLDVVSDPSAYPDTPDEGVAVAQVRVVSGAISVYAQEDETPTYNS